MRATESKRRKKRFMGLLLCAGWTTGFTGESTAYSQVADVKIAAPSWSQALSETARGGRPSLVLVTSGGLPASREWAAQVARSLTEGLGDRVQVAELLAETAADRVKALNVRTLPTALFYVSDGRNGLKLAAYRQGEVAGSELISLMTEHLPATTATVADNAQMHAARRVVRVQLASASTPVEPPTTASAKQAAPASAAPFRDEQVAGTTHFGYAQASAQGSPQSYAEPPGKSMPPSPVKTAPPQQSPPAQAPPAQPQPVYGAPPAQPQPQPQPVYGYYQQPPVYAAPPSSAPVMVQPPAGQVVVQPAPLNVMVAPSPPPQVTYMAPAMAQPMYAPALAAAPPANAFTAAPPAYSPPAAAPQPSYAAASPAAAPQPAYGAPQPAMGVGGLAPSMMMTIAPNLLDRFLGGLGRVLVERGNPRLRMTAESPAYFAAPAGVAAPPVSPLQTYMAVPNGGGDDATEAYLKAYIALCKEKGIKPTLPGMEQPPGGGGNEVTPPTGPVPSPQGVPARKKGWFH